MSDKIKMQTVWEIFKFKDENGELAKALENGASIEEVVKTHPEKFIGKETMIGNVALNEGLQAIINMICGLATVTPWNNANAYLGVGDGTTAESPTQTGLLGTNKLYKGMDAGYPQRIDQTAEWRATFGPNEANFAWNEFTVANGNSDAAINLNRKVESKGTKASGETWTLSLRITFS